MKETWKRKQDHFIHFVFPCLPLFTPYLFHTLDHVDGPIRSHWTTQYMYILAMFSPQSRYLWMIRQKRNRCSLDNTYSPCTWRWASRTETLVFQWQTLVTLTVTHLAQWRENRMRNTETSATNRTRQHIAKHRQNGETQRHLLEAFCHMNKENECIQMDKILTIKRTIDLRKYT